ncbi:hypothetical protein [Nocardia suismassiliense]|uniref:hypothetical protein n=1 Tax=Nocardia suismassiliense TaxID=2077092 RepID=UPI000D1D6B06|nr:hypothetical protein [Nocardia suismassiliense]
MSEHPTDTSTGIAACLKPRPVHLIRETDFSRLVTTIYQRPYNLQQQGGGLPQDSIIEFTIPAEESDWTGPSLARWQAATPPADGDRADQTRWEREFHPPLEDILNDLHTRGLLTPGDYALHVSW